MSRQVSFWYFCLTIVHEYYVLQSHFENNMLALADDLWKNWPIRYRVIKGICNRLKYHHEGLEVPILHLDLKPDNILLDHEMVPKIADFGLSRLMGEENTRMTISPLGTL